MIGGYGLRSAEAERRVRLQHRILGRPDHVDLEEVVHDREIVEPGLVRRPGDPRQVGGELSGSAGIGEVRDLETDLHAADSAACGRLRWVRKGYADRILPVIRGVRPGRPPRPGAPGAGR